MYNTLRAPCPRRAAKLPGGLTPPHPSRSGLWLPFDRHPRHPYPVMHLPRAPGYQRTDANLKPRRPDWVALPLRIGLVLLAVVCLPVSSRAADELVRNGGFEQGFEGWTRWGQNASLITLDSGVAHSGTNSARIQHGHNALYFTSPLNPGAGLRTAFRYRLAGANPSGQVALSFSKAGGALRSAGVADLQARAARQPRPPPAWTEFRQVFLPTRHHLLLPVRLHAPAMVPRCGLTMSRCGRSRGPRAWPSRRSLGRAEAPHRQSALQGTADQRARPLHRHLLGARPEPQGQEGLQVPGTRRRRRLAEGGAGHLQGDRAKPGMGYMDLPGRLDAHRTLAHRRVPPRAVPQIRRALRCLQRRQRLHRGGAEERRRTPQCRRQRPGPQTLRLRG